MNREPSGRLVPHVWVCNEEIRNRLAVDTYPLVADRLKKQLPGSR